MKRWIIKQWNLRSRAFAAWRQKHYARWMEFYAIERSIWHLRKKGRVQRSESAKIVKPSRQLHRAIGRKFRKLADQQTRKR